MAYKRKTRDEYCIISNCGYGWDVECYCDDLPDARRTLRDYQNNVNYPVKIQKKRVRIES